MPGQDGYEFIRALRALGPDNPASRTPAIALTAYARVEDRRLALAAGFQAHLVKPVDPDALLAMVAELAGR
jgi:CheY-like chemotaxis protein